MYGVTLKFPSFDLPWDKLKYWSRTTHDGREKKCYFCPICGSRIAHYIDGQPFMTLKACVDGLTKEIMDGAVHIYTKRALVPIPEGVEQHEGEPEGGTADVE